MKDVTPGRALQTARLTVAAEIAKIHTIEWTTQLLYDEVLYPGMNANWHGLFGRTTIVTERSKSRGRHQGQVVREAIRRPGIRCSRRAPASSGSAASATPASSASTHARTSGTCNPDDVNGGVEPFRFAVQLPRKSSSRSIVCTRSCRICSTSATAESESDPEGSAGRLRRSAAAATAAEREGGLRTGRVTMGRQRLGALTLGNSPQFLQNLPMARIDRTTKTDRRARARPDSRSRARRSAVQRVPSPVRTQDAHELRRLHQQAARPGDGFRRAES